MPTVPQTDGDAWGLIDRIIQIYGMHSGVQLSRMTLQEGGAWQQTGRCDGGVMLNADLAKYLTLERVLEEAARPAGPAKSHSL